MSVQDFIKKSILENEIFQQTFSWENFVIILISLGAALLMGLFVSFIYSKFFRGVVYSRTFSITLVGMTVMTCMVTIAISSNIVISLGMIGALSIVRYRTAIKEPMDLLYLFWAITSGITVGAKMYPLAGTAAIIMVLTLFIFNRRAVSGQVYIVVIHYIGEYTGDMVRRAMGNVKFRIKSKTIRKDAAEMAIEVFSKGDNLAFVDRIRMVENVQDVTLVQYDGEYHG
ncbi:MAG: DUF4956 domain-containing protein [Clostridiales bacterium GWF2_36_10]|nr:MAG: DUF4956 domain-containing protein [Clostridiales bacterium GWF2_36_10]HAN21777.1 DUF4956 domain-containing protein [Clostridiales bacterium]